MNERGIKYDFWQTVFMGATYTVQNKVLYPAVTFMPHCVENIVIAVRMVNLN